MGKDYAVRTAKVNIVMNLNKATIGIDSCIMKIEQIFPKSSGTA